VPSGEKEKGEGGEPGGARAIPVQGSKVLLKKASSRLAEKISSCSVFGKLRPGGTGGEGERGEDVLLQGGRTGAKRPVFQFKGAGPAFRKGEKA